MPSAASAATSDLHTNAGRNMPSAASAATSDLHTNAGRNMPAAANTLTLEQHIQSILTPYRILAIQSGHVKENKEEDEAIYIILTGNIARVVRHRQGRAISDVNNVSIVSVVGETGNHRRGGICHGMIAVLMCTKNFTYKIVEARLTETKDWLGELSKKVDEQMVVVLKEAVSDF